MSAENMNTIHITEKQKVQELLSTVEGYEGTEIFSGHHTKDSIRAYYRNCNLIMKWSRKRIRFCLCETVTFA